MTHWKVERSGKIGNDRSVCLGHATPSLFLTMNVPLSGSQWSYRPANLRLIDHRGDTDRLHTWSVGGDVSISLPVGVGMPTPAPIGGITLISMSVG